VCHLILFLPAFALPLFWVLPFEEALFYYLAVLGISFFLYFKIFQAMRQKVRTGLDGMMGERVVVVEDINPEGRIHYFSEIWGATTRGKKFFQGEQVKVVGMDGLMLVVEGVSRDQNII
jgi:membrane-bound ClpP family serine protease